MSITSTWKYLTDKNWKTWIGHAVLGIAIFFIVAGMTLVTGGISWSVAATAAAAYFFGREVTNLEPYVMKYITEKENIPTLKIVDGFFDFWTPMFVVISLALILG